MSEATCSAGRIARGEEGLRADALRIGNDRVTLNANGTGNAEAVVITRRARAAGR